MQQLIYISYASDRFQSGEVFKIIEASARNNPAREVTGFLVYAQDTFLQLVEGPSASLDSLLADLAEDNRHHGIEVLERRDIEYRSFPNWRMERLAVVAGDPRVLQAKLREAGASSATIRRAVGMFASSRAA